MEGLLIIFGFVTFLPLLALVFKDIKEDRQQKVVEQAELENFVKKDLGMI